MTNKTADLATLAPHIEERDGDVLTGALNFVRNHLGMDAAYLSEFVDDNIVFRAVDAPGFEEICFVGNAIPDTMAYCRHVLEGRLPELIPDTNDVPFSQTLDFTRSVPIRSHVSVPIHRNDGSVYGMFCCLSREPSSNLNDRDLDVLKAFASLSAEAVNVQLDRDRDFYSRQQAIRDVLKDSTFKIALQPIMRLSDAGTAGYEALCRFSSEPYRSPDKWFNDAAQVGLQEDLEIEVLRKAIKMIGDVTSGNYLALNTSPSTLASGRIAPLIDPAVGSRVIIEITEHAEVEDIDLLVMEIDRLRDLGVRIAIDDAGAGYSGLQQILQLRPDIIKLDMSLTKDVDKDVARRSLASALVQFAKDTNAVVVAEGIETEGEMNTLRELGVALGQGFYLGKPLLAEIVLTPRRSA